MEKNIIIGKDIKPIWENIKILISEVQTEIKHFPHQFYQHIVIVCTELLENSIKYGNHDNGTLIGFVMELTKEQVNIFVSNRLIDDDSVRILKGFIELIRVSNTEQLYIQRLSEIIANPQSGYSQMGLYRIVHEARFNLDYTINDGLLTMSAIRKI